MLRYCVNKRISVIMRKHAQAGMHRAHDGSGRGSGSGSGGGGGAPTRLNYIRFVLNLNVCNFSKLSK